MNTAQKTNIAWGIIAAAFFALFFVALCTPLPVFAQESAAVASIPVVDAGAQNIIAPDAFAAFVANLAAKYPWISIIVAAVGVLRLVFKPIVSFFHARAAATADAADDEALVKIERSWWFKALAWFLDYTASVKIK